MNEGASGAEDAAKPASPTLEVQVPVVAAPEMPAAEVPAAEVPAVDVPLRDVPATDVPAVKKPASEEPVIETPAATPAVERPATEDPAVESPAVEKPAAETPVNETPATEVPKAEVPAEKPEVKPADVPAAETPKVETPAEVPATDVPVEKPVDVPAETPAAKPVEAPAEAPGAAPAAPLPFGAAPEGETKTEEKPASVVKREDGTHLIEGRWTLRGEGTAAKPYEVPWDMLVSVRDVYNPRQNKTELPEWTQLLHEKHVRITGYLLLPLAGDEFDELLVMRNQWDGCCIGVPPTAYDAVEVKLARTVSLSRLSANYGSMTGVFKVDPYLSGKWLIGLYIMDGGVLTDAQGRNLGGE